MADVNAALSSSKNPLPILLTRAGLHNKLGHLEEELSDLSYVITNTSTGKQVDAGVYFSRAVCLKAMERFAEAIPDFSTAIQLNNQQSDSPNPLAYSNRGYCYRKLSQFDEAILDYTTAITLSKNKRSAHTIRAYNNRAYIYAKLNLFQQAISDYSQVIMAEPKNSHAYHNRGISYDKMGMIDLAIADFTKVLPICAACLPHISILISPSSYLHHHISIIIIIIIISSYHHHHISIIVETSLIDYDLIASSAVTVAVGA
jgi:tetratricopeptide (TPR) repeat protein